MADRSSVLQTESRISSSDVRISGEVKACDDMMVADRRAERNQSLSLLRAAFDSPLNPEVGEMKKLIIDSFPSSMKFHGRVVTQGKMSSQSQS